MRQRYQTRLGEWIGAYGVTQVADALALGGDPVTTNAVYRWLGGYTSPTLTRAQRLVDLAGGSLTLSDVYRHKLELTAPTPKPRNRAA